MNRPPVAKIYLKKEQTMHSKKKWRIHNQKGCRRVIVTKAPARDPLAGKFWRAAECRVEICTTEAVLSAAEIKAAIGDHCDGAIGQLTEAWGDELFAALKAAGGTVYSNYAVGYNNVDVAAATRHGIPVGQHPRCTDRNHGGDGRRSDLCGRPAPGRG